MALPISRSVGSISLSPHKPRSQGCQDRGLSNWAQPDINQRHNRHLCPVRPAAGRDGQLFHRDGGRNVNCHECNCLGTRWRCNPVAARYERHNPISGCRHNSISKRCPRADQRCMPVRCLGHSRIEGPLKDLPRKIQEKGKYDDVEFGQVDDCRADLLKRPDCFSEQGGRSRAQILNKCRYSKHQESDNQEASNSHPQHHPHRHSCHVHHDCLRLSCLLLLLLVH
jgi:hypothetical protein